MGSASPIGVFDSGVGGLAALERIHARMPTVDTIYLADQAFTPYGARPTSFIVARARVLTETLAERGCRLIVVACNTATAAAIDTLRTDNPDLVFVAMESAIKPAASATRSNVIGVLATEGTLSADRYRTLATAHSDGITIVHRIGHGLAMDVELGQETSPATRQKLRDHASAFVSRGADVVVLGCTHYSFLAAALHEMADGSFVVIDPVDAVARQAVRVATERGLENGTAQRAYLSTDPKRRPRRMQALLGSELTVEAT